MVMNLLVFFQKIPKKNASSATAIPALLYFCEIENFSFCRRKKEYPKIAVETAAKETKKILPKIPEI